MGAQATCCKVFLKDKEYIDKFILSSKESIAKLIKIQAIFRGYIFRKKKKFNQFSMQSTNNGSQSNLFMSKKRPGAEMPLTAELPELSSKIKRLKEMLPPFELNEKETFELKNENLRRECLVYPDKSMYKGYFNSEWLREGYGIYFLPDGSLYEGFFKTNHMHGRGRLFNIEGFCYEGEFVESKANGFGKFMSLEGVTYVGYWKDEKQHGIGEEVYPDGSKYEGLYDNGKKHGKGKFTCHDGQYYEGEFNNNDIHGKGTYKWKDGRMYSGSWNTNKMDGTGVFTWPDKKKYLGSYNNDNKQGYGVFLWPDGKKFEGSWSNGKQHGYGIFTNGITQYGEWKHGKKIRWIQKDNEEYDKAKEELEKLKIEYKFHEVEEYLGI
jgi:hypothetical protein